MSELRLRVRSAVFSATSCLVRREMVRSRTA